MIERENRVETEDREVERSGNHRVHTEWQRPLSVLHSFMMVISAHTDKKENQIFLIHKEIQMEMVAKSYMRKTFLIHKELRKYLTIYEEAVSVI